MSVQCSWSRARTDALPLRVCVLVPMLAPFSSPKPCPPGTSSSLVWGRDQGRAVLLASSVNCSILWLDGSVEVQSEVFLYRTAGEREHFTPIRTRTVNLINAHCICAVYSTPQVTTKDSARDTPSFHTLSGLLDPLRWMERNNRPCSVRQCVHTCTALIVPIYRLLLMHWYMVCTNRAWVVSVSV